MQIDKVTGSITAYCEGCSGSKSTFFWHDVNGDEFGSVKIENKSNISRTFLDYRLYVCAGCKKGALACIQVREESVPFPDCILTLISFLPSPVRALKLPDSVPLGIVNEFREAEKCMSNQCYRAASGLFRSVLDKTMRDNGYKTSKESLYAQIENAASDGVITTARKLKAHSEIRVLGNDVLHDDWVKIELSEVEASWNYCQRILEDFYDDRPTVLEILRSCNRSPSDDLNNSSENV